MTRRPKDVAASMRARLLQRARASGTDFNHLLQRFALERWLFRLKIAELSRASPRFIVKGGFLFVAWYGEHARHTRDLDLCGPAAISPEALARTMAHAAAIELPDGWVFDAGSVNVRELRLPGPYRPIRVSVGGHLSGARATVQIDVGRGDVVFPSPEEVIFPSVLEGLPQVVVLGYPREVFAAEKLHAIVVHGLEGSRLRDYGDLWVLSRDRRGFRMPRLQTALRSTFGRRRTALPTSLPPGLTADFTTGARQRRWLKELRRYPGLAPPSELGALVEDVAAFAGPVFGAACQEGPASAWWLPTEWRDG